MKLRSLMWLGFVLIFFLISLSVLRIPVRSQRSWSYWRPVLRLESTGEARFKSMVVQENRGQGERPLSSKNMNGAAAQVLVNLADDRRNMESTSSSAQTEIKSSSVRSDLVGIDIQTKRGEESSTAFHAPCNEDEIFCDGQAHHAHNGQHWKISRDQKSVFAFIPPKQSTNVSFTPRIIHFVWVSPRLRDPYTVPDELVENARRWEEMNPKWRVTLWTNTLIREHFPGLASKLLVKIDFPAWISDLSRYAILYKYGGLYIDADAFPVHPIDRFVQEYSPFTVCQGYDDEGGTVRVPFEHRYRCRRLANGIIATPPNTTTLRKTRDTAVEKSLTLGLAQQSHKGEGGKNKDGFHIGLTGPYMWKTIARHDPQFNILSQKTFLPCGFRNPRSMKDCQIYQFLNDSDVYGMHKLTWT